MVLVGFAMLLVVLMMMIGVPIIYSFMSATFLMVTVLGLDYSFLMSYGYDLI